MNGKSKPKPYFWPALFLGAFAAAAVLWVIWMYALVQKTRHQRQQNGFFVPQGPPPTNNAVLTNLPEAPTNPAGGK